jgi:DNA-binding IclR family transcriptional regulator
VTRALDAIAVSDYSSASDFAIEMGMSRQAAGRLLESLIEEGLVVRNEATLKLSLGLRVHSWGSRAVAQHLPTESVRQEIAKLAIRIGYSAFYMVRQGAWVFTLEHTSIRGDLAVTRPSSGRNHWSTTTTGRVLVAFAKPEERERLLQGTEDAVAEDLSKELDKIAAQGFGDRHTTATRYTIAFPILDDHGYALSVLAVVVTNFEEARREELIGLVRDAAGRCAVDLSQEFLSAVL